MTEKKLTNSSYKKMTFNFKFSINYYIFHSHFCEIKNSDLLIVKFEDRLFHFY